MDDRVRALHPRAAVLDIYKMAITATIRLVRSGGSATSETREFSALSSGLAGLAAWLLEKEVDAALMAGTDIYRDGPAGGQLKGRKTDVGGNVWPARPCSSSLAADPEGHLPGQDSHRRRPRPRHSRTALLTGMT